MKQIKFTEENLKRHLNAASYVGESYPVILGRRIHTVRDGMKGEIGDVFFIEGAGKFVLISVCTYDAEAFEQLIDNEWWFEGFNSRTEFMQEIFRIYGEEPKTYYSHNFLKLNGDD